MTFEVPPLDAGQGPALIPVRAIREALGAQVSWDDQAQRLTATRGSDTLVFTGGERTVLVDGSPVGPETPAVADPGTILVPRSFFTDGELRPVMGEAKWDGNSKTLSLGAGP